MRSNSFSANNGNGLSTFSVGGLKQYGNHHAVAHIPIVRIFEKRLSEAEVKSLYKADKDRFIGGKYMFVFFFVGCSNFYFCPKLFFSIRG